MLRLIFILFLCISATVQADESSDLSNSDKKNIIKIFGLGWTEIVTTTIGHEVMLGKHISGEFLYSFTLFGSENGSVNSSFRLGIKYNFKSEINRFFNNTYGGLFVEYVDSESWIDQTEFDHIESRVLGGGIYLGKMLYLTKWLLIELGLRTSLGETKDSRYGHDYIVVNNENYTRKVYSYSDKKEWKVYYGPKLLIGIRF